MTSPMGSDGTTITIVQGDDYHSDDSREITWTGSSADQWPDLTGATLAMTARNKMDTLTVVPTVTSGTRKMGRSISRKASLLGIRDRRA